jgi:hypothetical protein
MAQALDHPILPLTFIANADLTAQVNTLVRFVSGERINICAAGGAGFLGVLYKVECDPDAGAAGDECNVMVEGVAVVRSGGAFTPGANLTSDASGRAVVSAATNHICLMALEEATAADQYVAALIRPKGIQAA